MRKHYPITASRKVFSKLQIKIMHVSPWQRDMHIGDPLFLKTII